MATLATFDKALKDQFIGPIREQIYSNKILLEGMRTRDASDKQNMPQGSKDFKGIVSTSEGINYMGRTFYMPLHTGRNTGVGYRAEGGVLPTAGSQAYLSITDTLRYIYGQFRVTGPLIKASEKDAGAFARATASEMKRLVDDVKRRVCQYAYMTKNTNGTSSPATVTTGVASATQAVTTTIYLSIGDTIDVVNSAAEGTNRNATVLTITSINRSGLTVTFDASVTTTTNDLLIFASPGSTSGAPKNDVAQAPNGLGNIVASAGALHGLNPASAGQGFWQSTQNPSPYTTGDVVGDEVLRAVTDNIGFETGADGNCIGIWTRGIRNRYVNQLTALKQFTNDRSTTLQGGFKAVTFDDKALVVDDHCPVGGIFFLDCDAMFWSDMSDWEWMQEDGKVMKWDAGYDAYVGNLFKYHQLGTWARNRHGKITGASDDVR